MLMKRTISFGGKSHLFAFLFHFVFLGSLHRDLQRISHGKKKKWCQFGLVLSFLSLCHRVKKEAGEGCLLVSQLTLTSAAYQSFSDFLGEVLLIAESVMLVGRENFAGLPTFLLFTGMSWLTSSCNPPVTSIMVTATSLFHSGPSKAVSLMGYPAWQVLWSTSWQKRVQYTFRIGHIKKACALRKNQ